MRRLRRFLIRLTASVTRRRDDERLREDLEDHITLQTEANVSAGMSPADARRQAVLAIGPVAALAEDYRDEQRLPSLEHLLQDVRMALRRMKRAPGFTAAAVATLALGAQAQQRGPESGVCDLPENRCPSTTPRVVNVGRFSGDPRRRFPVSCPDYLYYRDHARRSRTWRRITRRRR